MITTRCLQISFLLPLCLVFVSGCERQALPEVTQSPFCDDQDNLKAHCRVEKAGVQFWLVSDNPTMTVEHPTQLTLITDQALHIESSTIRGLSMYMGRLPVAWQPAGEQQWQADVMLGACTDPDMLWELHIAFEKVANNDKRHLLQVPFHSTLH